jgi:hypothetical protein
MKTAAAAIPFAGFQLSEARYVCAFFTTAAKSILAAFTKGRVQVGRSGDLRL